jgi:MFS-type transporter involved in bile tolerance (Atg22 family)
MQFTKQSLTPLNHKEFRLFLLCRFFYIMALRMVATVVAYQLFQLTKSSFAIGIVGLSEFVPVFLLALYAGHVIDRSDKRTLLLKGISSYAICVAGAGVYYLAYDTGKNQCRRYSSFLLHHHLFYRRNQGFCRTYFKRHYCPTGAERCSAVCGQPFINFVARAPLSWGMLPQVSLLPALAHIPRLWSFLCW